MYDSRTLNEAAKIWNYMAAFSRQAPTDAIVVCCSYDLRVCDYACELLQQGNASYLVFSGNTGNWTQHLWCHSEASVFYSRAIENGVDVTKVLLEEQSTNFGENIEFSKRLLPSVNSIMLISKPNSLLRMKLTAEIQWPEAKCFVSSPTIRFPEQVCNSIGIFGVIQEMVGDIDRIQKYPASHFQTTHQLPEDIMAAWTYLVDQGFTQHLIPES